MVAFLPGATESAIANGDTRTINFYHAHTHESISATYMVNGEYDQSVLDKLNWFLRDWRIPEETKMDPRLFDVIWEVYRESGSQQPIEVMSAYRSARTNAMLRRRSRQVAEHSQHILGHAMDQHYMDVPMSRIRELAMKLQRGGVGFYPTAGSPFVHMDVGGVRHWPRMTYDQLARLFPDGKTVHIPSNGQPLPGYEVARAELEARGDGSYPTATQLKSKGFFAWLFGGGNGDEDEDNAAAGVRGNAAPQPRYASNTSGAASDVDVGNYGKNDGRSQSSFFGGSAPQVMFPSSPPPSQPAQQRPFGGSPHFASQEPTAPTPQPSAAPQPEVADQAPQAAQPVVDAPLPAIDPALSMPLPPRRPVELAALGPAAPLPPNRPSDLVSVAPHDAVRPLSPTGSQPDSIGALLSGSRAGALPDVITHGVASRSGPSSMVLGYAAPSADAVPLPVARPTALLSTHLDRSNFRSLTRPDSMEAMAGHSALGAAVAPMRAAAHTDLGALVPLPIARPSAFQSGGAALSSSRFSGSAGKPNT